MRLLLHRAVITANKHKLLSKPPAQTQARLYVTSNLVQYFSREMSSNPGDEKPSVGEDLPSDTRPQSSSKACTSKSDSDTIYRKEDRTGDLESQRCDTKKSISAENDIFKQREKYLSMDLDTKRKLYRSKYIALENIKTWPEYFIHDLKGKVDVTTVESEKGTIEVREDLNQKMSLFQGDITTLEIHAIANAANESLLGGGGVDGAIHQAAGLLLRSECEKLHGCDPGNAKITCGYNLPAKYVIHTVGPRGENPTVLASCYRSSLELLKENKLKSIAFPCISTGIFGYPNFNAAKVALSTIREWLEKETYAKNVERIILCLFLKVDVEAYHKLMPVYFPLSVDRNDNNSSNSEVFKNEE